MNILGIDGGGTKTHFAVFDSSGKIIGECKKGSASHWQYDQTHIKNILTDGLNETLEKASLHIKDISHVAFGMSGLGEDKEKDFTSTKTCHEIFGENITIVNDGVLGLVASLGGKPGINIVAGTGTIGFGIDATNHIYRCGGWGHQIGDEGSGYWLGMKTIELFTKESDGRLPKTQLYDLIIKEFNLNNDFEIINVMENLLLTRSKVASLQMLLSKAANNGDEMAIMVYNKAIDELFMLVSALSNKINNNNVSFSGGIFHTGQFFVDSFTNKLSTNGYNCLAPMFEPIFGAYLIGSNNLKFTFDM